VLSALRAVVVKVGAESSSRGGVTHDHQAPRFWCGHAGLFDCSRLRATEELADLSWEVHRIRSKNRHSQFRYFHGRQSFHQWSVVWQRRRAALRGSAASCRVSVVSAHLPTAGWRRYPGREPERAARYTQLEC